MTPSTNSRPLPRTSAHVPLPRWAPAVLVAIGISMTVWNPWGLSAYGPLNSLMMPAIAATGIGAGFMAGHRPPKVLFVGVVPLIVAAVVSLAASGQVWVGLLGMPLRNAGVLSLLTMLSIGLLGTLLGAYDRGVTLIAFTVVGGAAGAACIGLAHRFGLPLPGLPALGATRRAMAPYGSPAQLGAVMALALPPAFLAAARATDRRRRSLSVAAVVIITSALLASMARSAWIGAVAGVGTTVVLTSRSSVTTAFRARRDALGFVGLVVASIALVPPLRSRATGLLDITSGSGENRLQSWRAGFAALGERPILGVGPDQTRQVLPKHLPANYESMHGDGELLDRAHNVLLDHALWFGLAGTVALGFLAWRWSRAFRARRPDPFDAGLLGGAVAFVVHLSTNFAQPEIDWLLWLMLGGLAGSAQVAPRQARQRRSLAVSAAVAASTFGLTAGAFGWRLVRADTLIADGAAAEQRGEATAATNSYRAAVEAAPERLLPHEVLSRALLRAGSPEAADAAARAADLAPKDPFTLELQLRSLTLGALVDGDTDAAERLVHEYEALIAEVPSRTQFQVGLGLALLASGRPTEALTVVRAAAERLTYDRDTLLTLAAMEELLGFTSDAALHRSLADLIDAG